MRVVDDIPQEHFELNISVRSPFHIELTGSVPESAHRGELVSWNLLLTNSSPFLHATQAWVDGFLLGGAPLPFNPVIPPVNLPLGPGYSLPLQVQAEVPRDAPFGGPYRLCTRVGKHPFQHWSESCLEVGVVP